MPIARTVPLLCGLCQRHGNRNCATLHSSSGPYSSPCILLSAQLRSDRQLDRSDRPGHQRLKFSAEGFRLTAPVELGRCRLHLQLRSCISGASLSRGGWWRSERQEFRKVYKCRSVQVCTSHARLSVMPLQRIVWFAQLFVRNTSVELIQRLSEMTSFILLHLLQSGASRAVTANFTSL